LVAVHGFTQNRNCWESLRPILEKSFTLVRVDAPGHGRSSHVRLGLAEGAEMMVSSVARVAPTPAAWLGYSMGGRFCLNVALRRPAAVRALVLVSTTAGLEDPSERQVRHLSDEQIAKMIETTELESFLKSWLGQPLLASTPPETAAMAARLENTSEGLASSIRLAGSGSMEPVWHRLGDIKVPTLVVAGEDDHKYVEFAERMVASLGGPATLKVLPKAGHACHLEQPEAFGEAVVEFLEAL